MAKTILLTDLVITQLQIDYAKQNVRAIFNMVDDNGVSWETHVATFWITMPAEPTEYDFQLPTEYIPTLLQLKDDADLVLTNEFLI